MLKRLAGVLFLVMLLSISIGIFMQGGYPALQKALTAKSGRLSKVEIVFAERMPGVESLRRVQVTLNYLSGNKEQNGVFIANDMLMCNVKPVDTSITEKNTADLIKISQSLERPSYLMLIPTACAIQQSKVPYAKVVPLYDQRELIDSVYRSISGNVTAIDVYPTLFRHQDEYIYYRTDNAPTGMGGYYIYSVLAKRLGIANINGIEQFDVEHLDYQYYGDLYDISPYRAVTPDRVSAYEYRRQGSYVVTHYDKQGQRRYFTLYPAFKADLGNSMDVILGGVSPIVDIQSGNPQIANKKLLVFGDRSMQSYLPFLLLHYGQLTFVDTKAVTPDLLKKIEFSEYRQILFSYSVDRYINEEQFASVLKSSAFR